MEERVFQILKEHCDEILDYNGNNMMEDGIINSFMIIGIINDLEEEFDIEIDAGYVIAENFKNKDAIVALIKKVLIEGYGR